MASTVTSALFYLIGVTERRLYLIDDVSNWEKTDGADIFSSVIDIKEPVILDYGCGDGNYSFAVNP